ncbi:MAG: 16S rRNA (cytidine1402-2'-O)-methyltransferase [Pseudohongiellaceae bacterium]
MAELAALYVVATPIGNLGDMVPRAVEVLQSVDLIAAEDTRHSVKLMQHFGIETPLCAYHDHSGADTVEYLIGKIQAGQSIALISDAGTPLISDPGYRIVDAAMTAGIKIVPVPGASAVIAALSAAGLPSDRFIFEGFLPAKQQGRVKQLEVLKEEARTLIFYEAPHRVLACLQDMQQVMGGDRDVVMAREITKTFETIKRSSLQEMVQWVAADRNQQRGECVLLLRGAIEVTHELDGDARRIMDVLLQELSIKQASALAAKITGLKKKPLYQYGLDQKADVTTQPTAKIAVNRVKK